MILELPIPNTILSIKKNRQETTFVFTQISSLTFVYLF